MPHIGAARYGEKEKGKQLAPTTLQTSGLPTRSLVNVPNKLFHLPSVVGTRTEHRTCPFLNKVSAGKQPGQMNYKIQSLGEELHLHHQGFGITTHALQPYPCVV